MPPLDFAFGLIFLAVVTSIARRAIDAFSRGGKHTPDELRAAQDRARLLESELLDARRQNDQLQKQLDWHAKLLETQATQAPQDRRVTQPSAV